MLTLHQRKSISVRNQAKKTTYGWVAEMICIEEECLLFYNWFVEGLCRVEHFKQIWITEVIFIDYEQKPHFKVVLNSRKIILHHKGKNEFICELSFSYGDLPSPQWTTRSKELLWCFICLLVSYAVLYYVFSVSVTTLLYPPFFFSFQRSHL